MDSPNIVNVKYCAKPKNRAKNARDTASNLGFASIYVGNQKSNASS